MLNRNFILVCVMLAFTGCVKLEQPTFSLSSFSQPDQTVTARELDREIDPPTSDYGQLPLKRLVEHLQTKGVKVQVRWEALAAEKIGPETAAYIHTRKQSVRDLLSSALGNYPMTPMAFYEDSQAVVITSLEDFAKNQRQVVTYDLRTAKASLSTTTTTTYDRETKASSLAAVAADRLWRQLGSATVIGVKTPIYEFKKEPDDKLTITATPKIHAVVRGLLSMEVEGEGGAMTTLSERKPEGQ